MAAVQEHLADPVILSEFICATTQFLPMAGTFDSLFSCIWKEWDAFICALSGTDEWHTECLG